MCTPDESLVVVIDRLVTAEENSLVIVNEDMKVCGIISLSDILAFLVKGVEERERKISGEKRARKVSKTQQEPTLIEEEERESEEDEKEKLKTVNEQNGTTVKTEEEKNKVEENENIKTNGENMVTRKDVGQKLMCEYVIEENDILEPDKNNGVTGQENTDEIDDVFEGLNIDETKRALGRSTGRSISNYE